MKFKLIPFIISILIVLGGTVGLCLYSYYGYDSNHFEYLTEYLHTTDYATIPDSLESQVEKYSKLKSTYYQVIDDGLQYYDIKKAKNTSIDQALYTSNPSKSTAGFGIDGAKFENGVLHVGDGDNHYFDVMLLLEATYTSDMGVWGYNYYFAIFNINYDLIYSGDNLYLLFVNGDKYSENDELYGASKLDQVMTEFKSGDINVLYNPSTSFYMTYLGTDFTLMDTGATKNGKKVSAKEVQRLYTMTSSKSVVSDLDDESASNLYFHELNNVCFSIVSTGKIGVSKDYNAEREDYKEIVRGTLNVKYPNYNEYFLNAKGQEVTKVHLGVDDYVAAYGTDENIKKGQTKYMEAAEWVIDWNKTTYPEYIRKHIIVVGIISFACSSLVAFLFYAIWQDDESKKSQTIKVIGKRYKKQK